MKTYPVIIALALALSANVHAADSFIRPMITYIDPSTEGTSNATGFGMDVGAYFGAQQQHEASVEWGYAKWEFEAPSVAADQHFMPYLVNYRYHVPSGNAARFYIGPSIGMTNDIAKAAIAGLGNSDSSKWTFSYGASTGVRIKIGDSTDIDLGYRYLALSGTTHQLFGYTIDTGSAHANMFYAGLGFRWGSKAAATARRHLE